MKKVLFLWILLSTNVCLAQAVGGLFDLNNPDLMQDSISEKYDGKPVVLIEKPETQKQNISNPAILIPPTQFSRYNPELKIKTPFGHDWKASYVDQITDRIFVVQIFDDKTIQVEEQVQFITTDKSENFERIIPKTIIDEQGKKSQIGIQVLSFYSDTDKIHPVITDTNTDIKITFDIDKAGLHKITSKYLFQNIIQKDNSLAKIFLSLTGNGYPKITERFSVWVILPDKKVSVYKTELLFGKNNQSVKDNFVYFTDENNNLIIKTTRPLPAYTDVRLNLILDSKKIPGAEQNVFDFNNGSIFGIYVLILSLYTLISICECRRKKIKLKFKQCLKVNPTMLESVLSDGQKSFWVRIKSFFSFNIEYILGILFLILSLFFICQWQNRKIPISVSIFIILCGIVAVNMIYRYGIKNKLFRIKQYICFLLMETTVGINPPIHKIKDYYTLAKKWKIEKEWKKVVLKNNPSYQDKDFER